MTDKDMFEAVNGYIVHDMMDACEKLRRLHKVNQALVEALEEVCRVIKSNPPSICDTVWITGNYPETLIDHCLYALSKEKEST